MVNYRLVWSNCSECRLVSDVDRPELLWVCPTAGARDYDPTAEPGLIPAFGRINVAWTLRLGRGSPGADLRDPVEKAVLAFVRDWGHLGQTELAMYSQLSKSMACEASRPMRTSWGGWSCTPEAWIWS